MRICEHIINGICTNPRITSKGFIINDSKASNFFCESCKKEDRQKRSLFIPGARKYEHILSDSLNTEI
jgi:hypothetical protein